MTTDAELVRQVLAGRRDSFGELVRKYQGAVYGLAYHLLRHVADAQDAAQQAFIAAYQHLDRLAQPEKFAAWLYKITVNECRMWQRRRRETVSWETLPPDEPSNTESPAEAAERAELRCRVTAAVQTLPEAQRLAVTLFYMDGLSYQEVADFLSVPVSAVKGRLHRARTQLQEELMEMAAEILQAEKPGEEFTKAVQQAVPERVVEPFELTQPVGPEDTVLIYSDGLAVVRVQGGEDHVLRVSGRKVLFGQTEEEARQRSGQIRVWAGRLRDVWTDVPHTGERWCGTGGEEGNYHAYYASPREEWEGMKHLWQQEDPLKDLLPSLLGGEVVTVVAAGNRIDGLTVPYPLAPEMASDFSPGLTSGHEGLAFGPAASVALTVTVPPCGHLILLRPREVEVEGLAANLMVTGMFAPFTARRVQGNVFAYGAIPTRLEEVTGEVWIWDRQEHQGVSWDRVVKRVGDVPVVKLQGLGGDVQLECRRLNLDLRRVGGNVQIENEFGDTKLQLDEAWAGGRTAAIRSLSGPVALTLSAAADDRLRVSIWTEAGQIDRCRWPTGKFCYNTPETIYLGTRPEQDGADVQIRTRTGNVKVVRK